MLNPISLNRKISILTPIYSVKQKKLKWQKFYNDIIVFNPITLTPRGGGYFSPHPPCGFLI